MTAELAIWSLVLSAVGGIIATLIYIGISYVLKVRRDKSMFGTLANDYLGYSYLRDGFTVHWAHYVSEVKLTHQGGNALKIVLEHDFRRPEGAQRWEGTMVLDREYYGLVGKIAWEYKTFADTDRRFGFKDCIVNKEKDEIYLIGERSEGFGMEILRRRVPGQSYERMEVLPGEPPTN